MTVTEPVTGNARSAPIPIIRPWIGEEEVAAASEAIRSGWIAQGPNVAAFEQEFTALVGSIDSVAVSNCTTGLHLALIVAGIGAGDEVVVPSFSFIATTNSVLYVGATPVFADVDLTTGNITADTVAAAITDRTKAVMLVHQGGVPADIESLRALCDVRGLVLIEDAACALGSTYRGALIGPHSDLVVFSFHPRKLVTTGEGGMIAVGNPEWAARLRRLREHGMSVSAADRHRQGGVVIEQYLETGFNYRMTDIQAAIGRVQLGRLDELIARRRFLAARYHEALDDLVGATLVTDPAYGTTNYQSLWMLLDDRFPVARNDLMARLAADSISSRRGIMAAHMEPACARFARVPLPTTERLTSQSLILPLYHDMTDDEQARVITVLRDAAR
jgi:perosamine synthetase